MSYITYDPIHCIFETETRPNELVNPDKLRFSQLGRASWTNLEKAKRAVHGVLDSKISVLSKEVENATRERDMIDDWEPCTCCGVPVDGVDAMCAEMFGVDYEYLCETCYEVVTES